MTYRRKEFHFSQFIVPGLSLLGLVATLIILRSSSLSLGSSAYDHFVGNIRELAYSPSAMKARSRHVSSPLLHLKFNVNPSNQLILTSVFQSGGDIREQTSSPGAYEAHFQKNGTLISVVGFSIPESFEEDLDNHTNISKRANSFIITIPNPQADEVTIKDLSGSVIASRSLKNIPETKSSNLYYSVFGADYLRGRRESLLRHTISSPHATTANPNYLDIVFISQGFSVDQMADFQNSIKNYINKLMTFPPYASRADQILFHVIENTTDLGCTGPMACSSDTSTRVSNLLTETGVPHNIAVLIINSTSGSGTASRNPLRLVLVGKSTPMTFVHELGHVSGFLSDEYVNSSGGTLVDAPHGTCQRGALPFTGWLSLISPKDYFKGCTSDMYYRTSEFSIMKSSGYPYFNVISQLVIKEYINEVAGNSLDTTRPAVQITQPAHGSLASGTIAVSSTLSDNKSVNWAQLWVDDKLATTLSTGPFNFSLNLDNYTDGWHKLVVKAFDGAGNMGVDVSYVGKGNVGSPPVRSLTQVDYLRAGILNAVDASYVSNSYKDANYSQASYLMVKGTASLGYETYIKFNLDSLPISQLVSASLHLAYAQHNVGEQAVLKETNSSDWSESTLTYNNRPSAGAPIANFIGQVMHGHSILDLTQLIKSRTGGQLSLLVQAANSDSDMVIISRHEPSLFSRPMIYYQYYDIPGEVVVPSTTPTATPAPTTTPVPTITPTPTPTPMLNTSPVIATTKLNASRLGKYFTQKITAYDLDPQDSLSMAATGLPDGLSISNCSTVWNTTLNRLDLTCILSGTPTKKGIYGSTITVYDSAGHSTTKSYSVQTR